MSTNYSKIVVILLLSLLYVSAASCLLNKINTNLVVYANYEEDIQKLDIETKLTYINTDTGEKKPLMGRELLITVNVTKNSGENVTIEKEVVTNGLGWAKRTFYLDDAKEYQVLVTFAGESGFKETIGTVGGSGDFEQQEYTTNLPEGISLTACLPVMILIGFLGAAMYASGGNPFGFVDMTTNRGFRMNRNLRKTMFVQGVVGSIGNYAVKGVQVAMNVMAGKQSGAEEKSDKDQKKDEDKSKENTKKEDIKNVNQKVATTSGILGALQSGFLSSKPQEKKTDVKSKGKEVTIQGNTEKIVEIKEKRASSAFYTASRWINIVGAMFTGDSMLTIDRAKQISNTKVRQDKEKIFNKYVTLDSKKKEAENTTEKAGEAKKVLENAVKENEKEIEKVDKKINELVVHGASLLDPKLHKLRDIKKDLESKNKKMEQEAKGIDKKVKIAGEMLEKIKGIEEKIKEKNKEMSKEDIGKINMKSVDLYFDDKKESKKITEEISKVVETKCGFDKIVESLLNESANTQKIIKYALENEDGLKNLVEMDNKKLNLHNQMLVVGGKAIDELDRQNDDLKMLQSAIKNPEDYNMIKEIKERMESGNATKEDFAFYKDNRILFDENLQKEVMTREFLIRDENGDLKSINKGITLEDRINEIEAIKTEYQNKIKNKENELAGTNPEKIEKVKKMLNEEMNEKIEIFSNNNEYIYDNNNLIDIINKNKKQIFDSLKDVNSTDYNSMIVEKALNPESNKEFAEDYKEMGYKEFRKNHIDIVSRYEDIGIAQSDQKYLDFLDLRKEEVAKELKITKNEVPDELVYIPYSKYLKENKIPDWEQETANKLAKNIDELVEKSSKKTTDKLIGEMVGEYEIMKQFNPNKDESYERSEKIKSIIDKEIVQVTKAIKSESPIAFSTEDEDANLGRLKKRSEFLGEEREKINSIKENEEREKFFNSKSKTNTMKKNEEKPREY